MGGTVIITGANGSLGLGFVQHLLKAYPEHTLVGTVRNTSPEKDSNTAKLMQIIAEHKNAKVIIERLDLGKLADVRAFADKINAQVASGELPPVSAIVCNAFTWALRGLTRSVDGNDATFQVSHLSHYLLVLKLLEAMDKTGGRVVMLGSDTHYTDRKHPFSSLRAHVPENIEELLKPTPDEPGKEQDHGVQRYGSAKLANIAFMFDLNQRLEKDPSLSKITATAMDPAGMTSSRAMTELPMPVRVVFSVINVMMPVLRHVTSAFRTTEDSGKDLVEVAVGEGFAGKRGYFLGLKPDEPTALSKDPKAQHRLWEACWRWTGLKKDEVALLNIQ